jgi:hypothetical protein
MIELYAHCKDYTKDFENACSADEILTSLKKQLTRQGLVGLGIGGKILERRKTLAVASGLAVKQAEEMVDDNHKNAPFSKRERLECSLGRKIEVFENKNNPNEKYTHCLSPLCGLFIKGKIPFESYDDTAGIMHGEKGLEYYCPVCREPVGRFAVR